MGISIYSDFASKLQSIEQELHTHPVTEELREQIIHELDEIHHGLSHMDRTAAQVNRFANTFLDELRQKAVFLYGEVDDFFHKHEIEVIQKDTAALTQTLSQKNVDSISLLVDSLRLHIDELFKSYSPALSERRVLVIAAFVLEQAEALLQGKLFAETELNETALANAEILIEDLAEYLSSDDKRGLQQFWKRLSPDERKIVLAYLNPKDLLTGLLHDVERPADHHQSIRGF